MTLSLKALRTVSLRSIVATSVLCSLVGLTACDKTSDTITTNTSPKMQTIDAAVISSQTDGTNANSWQQQLGTGYSDLSEAEQQLLTRYMQRMQNSDATEKGAIESVTIGDALTQQQTFEDLQAKAPVDKEQGVGAVNDNDVEHLDHLNDSNLYPLTLLPRQTVENNDLKNVTVPMQLTNLSEKTVSSFKGTVELTGAGLDSAKDVVIPIKVFRPALAPNQTNTFEVTIPVTTEKTMAAINNPEAVQVTIKDAVVSFGLGQSVEIGETTS